MYKFHNNNSLGKFENDCVIRAISCSTGESWDYVYDYLSDIAQSEGTMMDDRGFVRRYLSSRYRKIYNIPRTVGEVAGAYPDRILLITMNGHITCSRYGVIYDSFDCRERTAEEAWIVM